MVTDSESEYSYDSEDELDDLIQYSKDAQAEANSGKKSRTDQDFLPNLIIYSTPKRRTVRWEKLGLNNRSAGISDPQIDELPFHKGTPLDPRAVEEN